MEVHTNTNCTLFFIDWNGVWHPLSQVNGVDKNFLKQFLYFSFDSCCFPRIDWMKLLPDRLSIRISHDFMFDDSWIYACHFLVRPGKHVTELFK
jgi:hypothetical protein